MRYHDKLTKHITLAFGEDHVLGMFMQIYDRRYIPYDMSGEGLVYDYDQRMGETVNLIGLPKEFSATNELIIQCCNDFIRSIIN